MAKKKSSGSANWRAYNKYMNRARERREYERMEFDDDFEELPF